jgi:Xaa-Pro aminopeptidase
MLKLPLTAYAARRARMLAALPEGAALLLPTNPEQNRTGDQEFPFRPHSDVWYASGFHEPGAMLLLRKVGKDPDFVMFVRPKDKERETWTGIRAGVDGAVARYGADKAFSIDEIDKELPPLLEDVDQLWFAFGRHPEWETRLHGWLGKLRLGRKAALGPASIVDPGGLLAELRLVKSDDELALMRQGAAITAEAHTEAMRAVRPGMHEYEIQALIEYTFRRRGAWGFAYPSIVGGGANACILHYHENDAPFDDGALMLVDAGAEVDGYATDVTRTSPVGGRFSAEQRAIYDVVLDAEKAAIDDVKPGATIDGIHDATVRRLVLGMLHIGLLQGSADEIIEKGEYKRVYMHRTSHWLGIDVHDVGRYHLRSGGSRPLVPGMVLTIEPGIYVAPDDDKAPTAFRGIGVRIEDDILVTASGHENLTIATPKEASALEALRG